MVDRRLYKVIFWCFWITICARETLQKCDDLVCKSGDCVPGKKCDGKVDCKDGSDETAMECAFSRCPSDSFRCTYGACVNSTAKCDGVKDCADNSDETAATCPGVVEKYSISGTCPKNQFQCSSGECITVNSVCDGKQDCSDGSDETGKVCASHFCPEFAFRCNYGACIVRDAQCDGIPDCADGSDESTSLCGLSHTTHNPLKPVAQKIPTVSKIPTDGCRIEDLPNVIFAYESDPSVYLRPGQYTENYESIIYLCPPNHVLEGSDKNICYSGNWNNEHPKCKKYCPYSVLDGVTYEATCKYGGVRVPCDPKGIPPGTTATINCQIGYTKQEDFGQNILLCREEGEWDYQPSPCKQVCGTEPTMTRPFIHGGQNADISLVPWHVAIYSVNEEGRYSYICGGTIINAKVVISAAHCFWDNDIQRISDKSRFAVGAGKYYRDYYAREKEAPQFFNLSVLHVPERYRHRDGFFQNDIAVLVVENYIKFKLYVKPICIEWQDYSNTSLKSDVTGRVAGWGIFRNSELSDELRIIDMPSLSYDECLERAKPEYKDLVTGDKFCVAATLDESVCSGDSGGGFVVPKKIGGQNVYFFWGIVSNALNIKGECSGEYLTAFTNIQFHSPMITEYETRFRPK